MKKCPYCAEEIQDNAVICRFCGKKVKGRWVRRFLLISFLLLFFACIFWIYKKTQAYSYEIQSFFSDFKMVWEMFKETLQDMKTGISGLEEYRASLKDVSNL